MRPRKPARGIELGNFQPELVVVEYHSTRRGDDDRGPLVRLNSHEARIRLVTEGELVRVKGPRRKELAVLVVDDSLPDGRIALRDVAGVTVSESVTVVKPDLDTPVGGRHYG